MDGDVSAATNGTLLRTLSYTFDSYGNVTSGDTSKTRYLFTSREFDPATDLQYNRARWYDAEVGRWISEDPLGFAAGDANVGRYVGNGAVRSVDPSGLQTTEEELRRRLRDLEDQLRKLKKRRAPQDEIQEAINLKNMIEKTISEVKDEGELPDLQKHLRRDAMKNKIDNFESIELSRDAGRLHPDAGIERSKQLAKLEATEEAAKKLRELRIVDEIVDEGADAPKKAGSAVKWGKNVLGVTGWILGFFGDPLDAIAGGKVNAGEDAMIEDDFIKNMPVKPLPLRPSLGDCARMQIQVKIATPHGHVSREDLY